MILSRNIALVGLGNVGSNLAHKLLSLDYPLLQIVSTQANRNDDMAAYSIEIVEKVEALSPEVDTIFLCIPDDCIAEVSLKLPKEKAVIHCSGSTPLLKDRKHSGVLYMLQTFSKMRVPRWEGLPIFIESSDIFLESWLLNLGKSLSGEVSIKSSEERKKLHLAGVFANNFVNAMLTQSEELAKEAGCTLETLRPLIEETVDKALHSGPYKSQTGPAKRGDKKLIEEHIKMLSDDETISAIYSLISKRIISTYK